MKILRYPRLRLCSDYLLLLVLWAVAVVCFGLLFRAMRKLFCLGFGC